jgi:hypothetical protein
MVEPVHKNTNAPLILIVWFVIFYAGKTHKRLFRGGLDFFERLFLPFAALRTIWGSKKPWPLRKTPRNRRLFVLPA